MKGIKDTQATIQNVNIKIDPVVKGAAEGVLSGMGLNMSAYIGMCLRQVAQDRKIPFSQTVDPDFWITEARVGTAKAYIDSGAFAAAYGTYEKMLEVIKKAHVHAEIEAAKAYQESINSLGDDYATFNQNNDCRFVYGEISDAWEKSDIGTAAKIISTLDDLPSHARSVDDVLQADNDDEKPVDVVHRFCYAYASTLESFGDGISEIVSSAFDSEARLRDVLDRDPTDLTVKEKADVLDSVIVTVLDVARDNPSNLSMRFVGSGGQSKLESVFKALDDAEEYRKWLAGADERIDKRRRERGRSEERRHQHMLDFIRATERTPSDQDFTKATPNPERDLTPEEAIEQAKIAKRIMDILSDENENEN